MSLGRRLLNIARAELTHAFRRVRRDPHGLDEASARRVEEEMARARARTESSKRKPSLTDDQDAKLRRYYANLELPFGAPAAEVRAAYRRLIRRYHPDRHHGDADAAKTATELTQRLRTAHDGLLEHLERRRP